MTGTTYEDYLRARRVARRDEAKAFCQEMWEGKEEDERSVIMRILQVVASKLPDAIGDPTWGSWG